MLMVGAAWGSLGGQRMERFLAPGNELELLNSQVKPRSASAWSALASSGTGGTA